MIIVRNVYGAIYTGEGMIHRIEADILRTKGGRTAQARARAGKAAGK